LARQDTAAVGLRNWFIVFFCALGFSAFTGGTTHGFIVDETSVLYTIVWGMTLIGIGVVGLAAWMVGLSLGSSAPVRRWLSRFVVAAFIIYCGVAMLITNSFVIAVVFYLPATLFLLGIFMLRYLKQRRPFLLSGVAGSLLTLVAAGIQQSGYGLHPVWFDHNALYHLIQAVAILLLFFAARGLTLGENT
jgi:hypothetical protein